jgi:hypothetical protein
MARKRSRPTVIFGSERGPASAELKRLYSGGRHDLEKLRRDLAHVLAGETRIIDLGAASAYAVPSVSKREEMLKVVQNMDVFVILPDSEQRQVNKLWDDYRIPAFTRSDLLSRGAGAERTLRESGERIGKPKVLTWRPWQDIAD